MGQSREVWKNENDTERVQERNMRYLKGDERRGVEEMRKKKREMT